MTDRPLDLAAQLRREQAIQVFLPLFFVSGATSLIYQTVWVRQLHLVFGTSTFAIATVLAAFMGGLALGGWVLSRVADHVRRPLLWYGGFEGIIGAWALAFPWLLDGIRPAYLATFRHLEPGPVTFGLIQFVFVAALLVVPTALMGATLPLLARFATDQLGAAGDRVGRLYAVNTAGAVFGIWLGAFVLLPTLGLWKTTVLAASANLALGLAGAALDRWARAGAAIPVQGDDTAPDPSALRFVAWAMGFAGFASLVYEVAWTRVLSLLLGPTVYGFAVMLLAFLTGIAIGGRLGGPWADRARNRGGQASVLRLLAATEAAVAVLAIGSVYLYPELPIWYVWLFDALGAQSTPSAMWWVSMILAGLVMTPAAIAMGVAFPVAVRAVVTDPASLGRPVGVIYAANTLGGALGALLGGFVLLPTLEVSGTLQIAAAANGLAAAGLIVLAAGSISDLWRHATPLIVLATGVLLVAGQPPWDPRRMTAGTYHYVSHFEDHSRQGIHRYGIDSYDLLYYREGLSAVVTVGRSHEPESLWLATSGKVDASVPGDLPTQVLLGLLPLQFVESPRRVLVIGLASAITPGAVALSPRVEQLDVVEIEPATAEAAAFFEPWNHGVLSDPRLRLIANDGRNHVLLSAPGSYDLVISEPSSPWISGPAQLFTREFFELGRSRLAPGGVWTQWIPTYGMDPRDLHSLLSTFADVFPHVVVYWSIDHADLVVMGALTPLEPGTTTTTARLQLPSISAELRRIDIRSPADLLARYQFDRTGIEAMGPIPYNTDDNMRIEYGAPLHQHLNTTQDNDRFLSRFAQMPRSTQTADPLDLLDLAYVWAYSEDPRARSAFRLLADRLPADHSLIEQIRADADALSPTHP